ncbi:MAG: 7-cyano-7-deazaguanine synthase [Prevotella sp.]|nr:7-cyano-7-deazaguanine synthase [Prevotella sp.]
MKIKTTGYIVQKFGRHDYRLSIGLSIETAKAGIIKTAAIVQLCPIAYFHGKVDEQAYGLLFLSAIVYAIDRSVDRHVHSIDGWSREFDVDIMVPANTKFQGISDDINRMLSFLTGDYWTCQFIGEARINYPRYKTTTYYDDITQVNLFSGGMDSLIGAVDYLANNPNGHLYLSSHYDQFMRGPQSDQVKVKHALINRFDTALKSERTAVMISPKESIEMSCRSRSLMFLSLATIVASYASCDVVVPENGSVSINYPLSPSRRAACSTRTTHPIFIKAFQNVLQKLGLNVRVYNPYEFMTKGEMVRNCADKDFLLKVIPLSNSCGKRHMHQQMYDNRNATHCAHCMPCMYRKAALIGEVDPTSYGNRLETIFKKRKYSVSNDFFAMLEFLKLNLSKEDIKKELYIAGMSGFPNIEQYVDLVKRTRKELEDMLHAEGSQLINQYMGWI